MLELNVISFIRTVRQDAQFGFGVSTAAPLGFLDQAIHATNRVIARTNKVVVSAVKPELMPLLSQREVSALSPREGICCLR